MSLFRRIRNFFSREPEKEPLREPVATGPETGPVPGTFILRDTLWDFYDIPGPPVKELPVLTKKEKQQETERLKKICFRIADANGLEAPAIWTMLDGKNFTRKNLFGNDDVQDDIVFNASYTRTLTDDQVAMLAGQQFATIHCLHNEERKLLGQALQYSNTNQIYKIRSNSALCRCQVFEKDRVGMLFAVKAGYERVVDLSFLRHPAAEGLTPSKRFDVLAAEPKISERETVLSHTLPEEVRFDKNERIAIHKTVAAMAKEKEKYLKDHWYRDGVYVGLTIPQEEYIAKFSCDMEQKLAGRVLPELKSQYKLLKALYNTVYTELPVKRHIMPKQLKDIDFGVGRFEKFPDRAALRDEVLHVIQFVRERTERTAGHKAQRQDSAPKQQEPKRREKFHFPGKANLKVPIKKQKTEHTLETR